MFSKNKIVLIPFPFTDLSGSKVRPAVIISDNVSGNDIVVSFISSNNKKASSVDLVIQKSRTNSLKKNSVVKTSKIATLDKKIILGELGELDKKLQKQLDTKLKKVFGL